MQDRDGLIVLVTGASGRQGGAVARRLLDRGHRVRGLCRDAVSPAADELRRLGADVRAGAFEDEESLRRAARGVDALFAVTTPASGAALEIVHARAVFDAARAERVGHVVFSSLLGANRPSGLPCFEAKRRIEACLGASSLPFTVVRPAWLLENVLAPPPRRLVQDGVLRLPLDEAAPLPQLALSDLAAFAAHVLENRRAFLGRALDLASDQVTGPALARAISEASGRSLAFRCQRDAEDALDDVQRGLLQYASEPGSHVDVAALRRDFPELGWRTVETWASEQAWEADAA